MPPRRSRRVVVGIAALMVVAAVLIWFLPARTGPSAPPGGRAGMPPAMVKTVTATVAPVTEEVRSSGTIQAAESVTVTAQATGRVEQILFQPGQRVAAGAVLVELDAGRERAQLRAARVALREAQQQAKRVEELAGRGLVARAQVDQVRAARQTAAAQVAEAKAALAERHITAPFAGTVGLHQVSPGALVQPGDPITTLATLQQLKLRFALPADLLPRLRPGLRVVATAPGFPQPFPGRVTRIDNTVDPASRTIALEAVFSPGTGLKPGLFASVDLILEERRGVVVPEEAVVLEGEGAYVYAVTPRSTVARKPVTIGERRSGRAEVTEGLAPGTPVVVAGAQSLQDGQPVRVVEGQASGAPTRPEAS